MNIALIGYGKMGREIEQISIERGHSIAAKFDIDSPLPSADLSMYTSTKIDCCIDFSTASVVTTNVGILAQRKIPIVIGTTGWNDQLSQVKETIARHNGSLIYGSNFSVGAHVFFKLAELAAELLNNHSQYDAAVHEIHHTMKKDAPSGTALTIAQKILSRMKRKTRVKLPTETSLIQPNDLLVSSSRVGTVFGTHSVLFNSLADDIELTHRAHNRKGFALGAVLAAEWIQGKKGVFTVEDMIFENKHSL
ncbi:MAG: 4-hydroxy-tetrahydrodipicolinate reductase [Bacteroidota bacterium]|nr:4-hydroxy-tetrahydrodipicolinate reductase [Bacteroidota bacterium]